VTRTIDDHKVNPANDRLSITVTDEPGAGGANHAYEISGFDLSGNPSAYDPEYGRPAKAEHRTTIYFQNGPINEAGVNGVTQEVLLAIVVDRLKSFQAGQYACRENALALTHIQEAQHWLQSRTRDRMTRGVEGTHAK
jgi:hypothetical protein